MDENTLYSHLVACMELAHHEKKEKKKEEEVIVNFSNETKKHTRT